MVVLLRTGLPAPDILLKMVIGGTFVPSCVEEGAPQIGSPVLVATNTAPSWRAHDVLNVLACSPLSPRLRNVRAQCYVGGSPIAPYNGADLMVAIAVP